jgi:hypothetical protein
MKAEILARPPASGSFEEVKFDAYGNCTWIVFSDGAQSWAGVFGRGRETGVEAVAVFASGQHALVIAWGRGYLVDLTSKTSTLKFDLLNSLIAVPGKDIVIMTNYSGDLIECHASGQVWIVPDPAYSHDVIVKGATPDKIFGTLDENMQGEGFGDDFIYDLNTHEFTSFSDKERYMIKQVLMARQVAPE